MIKDLSVMIAGKAGDGVLFTGSVLAKLLKRHGSEVATYRDFPSNIRGEETVSLPTDQSRGKTFHKISLRLMARTQFGQEIFKNMISLGALSYTLDLDSGGTFIARGFSGEVAHFASLIEKGMTHKGFALVEVLSSCVTHNKVNSYEWYRKNIFAIENEPGYNPKDKKKAWEALQHTEKIATGLIFEEEKPTFEELILSDKDKPIAFNDLAVDRPSLEKIMEKFC